MIASHYGSSLVHRVTSESCRQNRVVHSSLVAVLFILLLHVNGASPAFGQKSQANSPKQKGGESVRKEPKSKSGFPAVEAALRRISKESRIKLQIKKTGYFNHQKGNTAEPGSYFRLPLSDDVRRRVVGKLKLVRQKNTHDNVRRMLTQFPYGWPKLNLDHCEWFGYRHNTEDSNYGNLMVMVADKKSKVLYLLVANWDYTP